MGGPFEKPEEEIAVDLDRVQPLMDERAVFTTHGPAEGKADTPCYIGGWSAFEHWDLTEQLFRDVLVCTTRQFRSRDRQIQGVKFRLRRRWAKWVH